jgi:hypothetical protein
LFRRGRGCLVGLAVAGRLDRLDRLLGLVGEAALVARDVLQLGRTSFLKSMNMPS